MSCQKNMGGKVFEVEEVAASSGEPLVMTPEAADYVSQLLKKDEKSSWGLKVEVVPGGCAGYKYYMDFQEAADEGDVTFEFHGTKVFLTPMSANLMNGSTIEFIQSLEATGLKVNNPNATKGCACGKSFG